MNPDEKNENNLAPESDEQEGTPDEPAGVMLEQPEEGEPDDLPEAEEGEDLDAESDSEAERAKRAGRVWARFRVCSGVNQ